MTADLEAESLARRVADAMRGADAATTGAGVELVEVGPGRALARLVVERRHVNGHGLCHGGYLFLLADAAFAYACNSYGTPTVAAGAEITFLRPGKLGDELRAEARVRAAAGRTGVYDVTIRVGDAVVAEFRGHSREVPSMPQPPGV
ncbi:hydroxyphenylacetyl-CoA thioesterase PaaI [Pseudonocardia acaciae]|uniref:hydroxyphenylacetyl-CoA thioesterase PaaI n=1 Tax=Pseudonocardia acaciae TaxID=551276 RepID=UPI00048F813D|nr:hydroxyphenylacetyl-CoA thioesterase PaaI [Pseudonocardia acaciae]